MVLVDVGCPFCSDKTPCNRHEHTVVVKNWLIMMSWNTGGQWLIDYVITETGQYGWKADLHAMTQCNTWMCLWTSMVCGIPDAGSRKLCRTGGCSNSWICEACDSGQEYRQTPTGKLILTAHLKELQPSLRSSTLSNTHLSFSTPRILSYCGSQQEFNHSVGHPQRSRGYFCNKWQTVHSHCPCSYLQQFWAKGFVTMKSEF